MARIVFIKVHPPYLVTPERIWSKREYRERWLPRQTKELGHDSALFLLSNSMETWSVPDYVDVTFFPVDDRSVSKNYHTSLAMLESLVNNPPDLIVFKGLAYHLSSWILEKTEFKIPFAFIVGGHCHDKYLDRASYILAETEEQIRDSFSSFSGRVDIFPKSLDHTVFSPSEEKEFDIINVGSMEPRKNHASLFPFFEKYRIALVGNGPNYLKIKRSAEGYSVYMPGDVSTSDVAALIARSRVMVHPSIWEGFPRVLIESMACGVPVVAFESTIHGIIENGRTGLLVDSKNLVKETVSLLDNPEQLMKMGNAGRKLVIEKFGKDSTIPVLEKMYSVVFGGQNEKSFSNSDNIQPKGISGNSTSPLSECDGISGLQTGCMR
jgi:glycosyltransferase involved in cell wall biosynthesis